MISTVDCLRVGDRGLCHLDELCVTPGGYSPDGYTVLANTGSRKVWGWLGSDGEEWAEYTNTATDQVWLIPPLGIGAAK